MNNLRPSNQIPPPALHRVKRNVATRVATPTIFRGKSRYAANKTRGIEREMNYGERP